MGSVLGFLKHLSNAGRINRLGKMPSNYTKKIETHFYKTKI
jgi:hypothetical protein